MKYIFTLLFCSVLVSGLKAQPCTLWPRYDQEVFSAVDITTDVVYGTNVDYQGVTQVLKMDIYEPQGDTLSQRPLIVFAHGGSFVAGDKSNSDQVDLCTHFAKRGYVCATINYRLGIAFPIGGPTATDAVYRSLQDMKAGIRFFRKDAATTNVYKIDPSVIFIGGTSAGAFAALQTAYMNTYAELPATIDTAQLGDLDGNSGNDGYSSEANAVINLCGALGDAAWIIPGDIPLCSMHGTNDQTVPYSSQMLYLLGIFPIMVVDGSYAIHDYIRTFNHPAAMYTWPGAGHVPYDGGTPTANAYLDTTLRFVSNFLYEYMGCTPSDTSIHANTVFTGIEEHDLNYIQVVSNPADQVIELKLENAKKCKVALYDNKGSLIYDRNISSSDSHFYLPSASLPEGLYFIRYKDVEKQGILKVMVHHQ